VRVGKNTGFVPLHPSDQKDKPPVNLQHGIFTLETAKGGEHLERINYNPKLEVKTLAVAPKEFRAGTNPELAKAEQPRIEGRLLADRLTLTRNETRISYDYGKGAFVRAGMELGGRRTNPVVVGSLNARGSFAGSGDRSGAGRSGGDGGGRGGSGGGWSGGRSGGSGGGGESSGGGSSGGGGHPR
jgi:hypothetical protein